MWHDYEYPMLSLGRCFNDGDGNSTKKTHFLTFFFSEIMCDHFETVVNSFTFCHD